MQGGFKMKLLLLASTLLCVSFSAVASYNDAEEAFNNHYYTDALSGFMQEIKKNGDYRAQFYVGKIYLEGLGVNQDTKKGLDYLQQSADQGYDSAQALLGYLYEEGKVVPQNKRKAINLYKDAASHNNSSAMFNLGLAYYQGDIVAKDDQKAIELLEKVPADVIPMVGRYLGDIYLSTNDLEKAIRSYEKSAKQEDIESYYALANIYAKDEALSEKAVTYYSYAASQGSVAAQYMLGTMYANGDLVSRNVALGHAWLKMAADQRYSPAEESRKQLEKDMSRSDLERARKEFLKLQQDVLGKLESPFIEEQRIQAEIDKKNQEKMTFNAKNN